MIELVYCILIWRKICSTYYFNALSVRRSIYNWLGMETVDENSTTEHFNMFSNQLQGRMKKRNSGGCWLAVVWNIWRMRNYILFNDKLCNLEDLINNIKLVAWFWQSIGLKDHKHVSFYDRYHYPA